mmetsp:Transcript_7230/g.10701  ORF Transcript_7230/g.10701 Transcript_7230/m.10701 type:complete len:87 (-) Transcript_7230:108-368(-)
MMDTLKHQNDTSTIMRIPSSLVLITRFEEAGDMRSTMRVRTMMKDRMEHATDNFPFWIWSTEATLVSTASKMDPIVIKEKTNMDNH